MPTAFDNLYSTIFDPFRHNRNRQSSVRSEQQRRPTPQSPAAARQPLLQGPGAMIGGGGNYEMTQAERDAAQRFGGRAGQLARGSTRRPELPASVRPHAPSYPIGPGGVASPAPVEMASLATGAPREYLSHLIGHESGGDANARASTSSATGHGQFIESTWLDMMRRYGARYGAGDLAAKIVKKGGVGRSGGSRGYTVNDREARDEILALRENPEWAAIMTAHYADENASALRARLGRNVREGEVYLAHFLGDAAAADLIRAASRETQGSGVSAVSVVGRAAAEANRNVFYTRQGVPRTAREVVELQTRGFRRVLWPERTREARQP